MIHLPPKLYKVLLANMPKACLDLVVLGPNPNNHEILLVKRTEEPAKDAWWLPGGRLDIDDFPMGIGTKDRGYERAIQRIAKRELGSEVKTIAQVGSYPTKFSTSPFPGIGTMSSNLVFLVRLLSDTVQLDSTSGKFQFFSTIEILSQKRRFRRYLRITIEDCINQSLIHS